MSGDAIPEDILFCLTIPEHDTAQGMFSVLRGYIDEKQIPWCLKVGFGIDRAPSIYCRTARRPLHSSYECVSLCHTDLLFDTPTELQWIHREQLAAKELSAELRDKLQQMT